MVLSQIAPNPIGLDSSVLMSAQTRPIISVALLSYVVFSIDNTCMIDQIIVLSSFHHRLHTVRLITIAQFFFYVNYAIQLVMLLSCLVFVTYRTRFDRCRQFSCDFFRRPYLHNRSHCCPIWFLSQTTPSPISHNTLVYFLVLNTFVRSITLLSCLIFVTDNTRSDQSRWLNFIFDENRTCMVKHVVFLSGLGNISHLVRQVLIVQFRLHRRPHLQNWSCHCPIQFSSQTAPYQIGPNYLVLILAQTTLIQSVTLLS